MRSLILTTILLLSTAISTIAEEKLPKWSAPHGSHYSGDYVELHDDEGQGYNTLHVRGYAPAGNAFFLWACFIYCPGMAEHPELKVLGQMSVDPEAGTAETIDNYFSFVIYSDGSKGVIHGGRKYKKLSEQDGADQPATALESKPEGKEKPQAGLEGRPQ